MKFSLVIQLPLLHGITGMPGISLFPGHGEVCPENMWQPEDLPYSPSQAALLLAHFRSLSLADVEQMHHGVSFAFTAEERRLAVEAAHLADFVNGDQPGDDLEILRMQAQKNLLWQWHIEEMAEDIQRLSRKCAQAEERLRSNFKEEAYSAPPLPESAGESDAAYLPWTTTLVNAAFFLPAEAALLPLGTMAEDIREGLDFQPCSPHLNYCRAPIFQVLGYDGHWLRNLRDRAAEEIFAQDRIWLCEGGENE